MGTGSHTQPNTRVPGWGERRTWAVLFAVTANTIQRLLSDHFCPTVGCLKFHWHNWIYTFKFRYEQRTLCIKHFNLSGFFLINSVQCLIQTSAVGSLASVVFYPNTPTLAEEYFQSQWGREIFFKGHKLGVSSYWITFTNQLMLDWVINRQAAVTDFLQSDVKKIATCTLWQTYPNKRSKKKTLATRKLTDTAVDIFTVVLTVRTLGWKTFNLWVDGEKEHLRQCQFSDRQDVGHHANGNI